MTKILFGGSAADFAVEPVTVLASAGGTASVLKLAPSAPLEAWTAGTGGSQVTDLALFTGDYTTPGAAAPAGIFPTTASSTFLVWAEDSLDYLFVVGQGAGVTAAQRWIMRPINDIARLRALEALNPIGSAAKGAALGVAPLDAGGLVPAANLPASGVSGVIDVTTANGGTDSGHVTLSAADLGAALATTLVSPGTGLSGGGDLSANRTLGVVFGTAAGTVAQGNDSRFSAIGTSPRPVYAAVLSNDAPTDRKTAAASDPYVWVCDGTNDEVQINLAIDAASPKQSYNAGMPAAAASLGKVQLSGGRFNIGAAGIKMRTAVHLDGAGMASTDLRAVACNQPGMISLAAVSDHLCHLSNFYLNGNGASGGTCSAIDFDMTGSGSTTAYPASSPDSYHQVSRVYISQFSGTGRHGIYMHAAATANNRGNRIDAVTMRDCGGNGIYLDAASDCTIANTEIGGSGGSGFHIATGNTKIIGCKSFYSGVNGFYFNSGRGIVTGCESQDDDTGFFFDGSPQTATGLVADSPNVAGIRVSSSDLDLVGCSVFSRGGPGSGIRFEVSQRGIWYDGTYSRCTILGNVKPSTGITTAVSGTAPSGNVNVVTS